MPSSADRKRLEVPTYLHERLVEIAIDEDRTVSSIVQEIITLGLEQYTSRLPLAIALKSFTQRAQRALEYAKQETIQFNHHYVGTEHILLGLLREHDGAAARILAKSCVDIARARDYIDYHFGRGTGPAPADLLIVPRARRVLRLAQEISQEFDSGFVGTEHLLLALVQVKDGAGAKILASLGVAEQVQGEAATFIREASSRADRRTEAELEQGDSSQGQLGGWLQGEA